MDPTKEESNVYALDVKDKYIYISDAKSGKNGYFCIGCKAELVAVKGEINRQHFRHYADDIALANRCQYKDETYRHQLAKDILQRLKKIKVPTTLKFPPESTKNGYILQKSHVIEAHSVEIELSFFEDNQGNVVHGKNFEGDTDKHFLIKPDVTFLNKEGNPILFIELVATHKVDKEKLFKIRLLGIDTVEVSIPKDSAENIEKAFLTTTHTKWLYNYEQANALYAPSLNSEEVSSIDGFEKRILEFDETYECRKAKINNLIREIERCLESEPYRSADRNLRSEISRVEANQNSTRVEWENLRSSIQQRVRNSFVPRREKFEEKNQSFRTEEAGFEKEFDNLEGRYKFKDSQLGNEEKELRAGCQEEIDRTEAEIERTEAEIEQIEREIEQLESRITGIRSGGDTLEQRIESLRANSEERIRYAQIQTQGINKDIKQAIRRTAEIKEECDREIETGRAELDARYEKLRGEAATTIKGRDLSRVGPLTKRIRDILDARRFTMDLKETDWAFERIRKAKELFDNKSFKHWTNS